MNFRLQENMLLGAAAPLEEDGVLEQMEKLGLRCCRAELDWRRIEPADGAFDERALAACRASLQALLERGIRPLLVLQRFSLPVWLEERGGFAYGGSVTCYLRYVHRVLEALGDLVGDYITFDEPNCLALAAYLPGGEGKRSLLAAARSMTNLAAAHIEAYGLIRKTRLHAGRTDTRVGVSPQLRDFVPKNPQDPVHRFWASRSRQIFQASLTRAMCLGRMSFPIGGHPSIVPGRYCDFHAPSCGGRCLLSGPALSAEREPDPAGAAQVCRALCDLLPRPLLLTVPAGRPGEVLRLLQALQEEDLPVESVCLRPLPGEEDAPFYRALTAQGGISEALLSQYCEEDG